jgi:BirA family biotin operon repressor/biotin-[acetyl-CoA-carboxylase] ligase
MHLTCAAAVAMCHAVEKAAGFRPGIKWTNDLVFGTRKLGGILTELGFTPKGTLDYAVIGIGINCRQQEADFPEEIRQIAASVSMVSGRNISPARLAAAMLEALAKMDTHLLTGKEAILDAYRTDCVTVGKEISVLRGDDVRHGTALSVDDEGALVVVYPDGTQETVNAGEVSIRGMYGYL